MSENRTQTRENIYVIPMVNRTPRKIVGFDADFDKSAERVQRIVDSAPDSEKYCTDGWLGYIDVVNPGIHKRNCRDKSDTFTVEGVNADLRHYIPIFARRSRCFARKLDTLKAVINVLWMRIIALVSLNTAIANDKRKAACLSLLQISFNQRCRTLPARTLPKKINC